VSSLSEVKEVVGDSYHASALQNQYSLYLLSFLSPPDVCCLKLKITVTQHNLYPHINLSHACFTMSPLARLRK